MIRKTEWSGKNMIFFVKCQPNKRLQPNVKITILGKDSNLR